MIFGELNFFFLIFFLILFNLLINNSNSLNLLLIAELLWITLYFLSLFIGIIFNNLNVLSLTFFFLVFSAIELSLGLLLLLIQTIFTRSTNLIQNDINYNKFNSILNKNLYSNKIQWKF